MSGPVRYFAVVGLHPTYALIALAMIALLGVVTVWLDAAEIDSGLGMVLFSQMFLASTGFVVRARQGHFDPLLTGRSRRTAVAAAHWLVSIAPGLAAWLTVSLAGWFVGSPAVTSAIAGSRAAGLLIVSTVAWALGFALPRGAAGMLWTSLLILLVMQRAELLAAASEGGTIAAIVRHAATLLVCPFVLLGRHPPVAPGAIAMALVVSLMVLLAVWRRSRDLDIYLVDRS